MTLHSQTRNQIKATILSCLLGLAATAPAMAAVSAAKTKDGVTAFKSTVLVNSGEIKADSLIRTEGSARLREELAAVQIGFIPNPLGEVTFDRQTLTKKLGNLARDVVMPERITVKRNGAILKGAEVKAKIIEVCQQHCDDELDIDLSRVPANLVLPGNINNWEITSNSENTLGMKLLVLTAETDGGPFRQLLQIRVTRTVEAAQLTRLAKPGETLGKDMIKPKKVVLKSDQATAPVSYKEALGKGLGRFKSAGTLLRPTDLSESTSLDPMQGISTIASTQAKPSDRASLMVKPGENVDFHVSSGNLSLKIPAKAVVGGNPGDEITLINLQNKRRIKGVITEKGTVEYAKN